MMERKILPNDVLLGEVSRLVAEGESVTIMTKGTSMLPFIVGGRDSVRLVRPAELQPGMIVLAELHDGRYVLHRLISVDGQNLTLMGDGNIAGVERCRVGRRSIRTERNIRDRPGYGSPCFLQEDICLRYIEDYSFDVQ